MEWREKMQAGAGEVRERIMSKQSVITIIDSKRDNEKTRHIIVVFVTPYGQAEFSFN